jgi:hypothetical protein
MAKLSAHGRTELHRLFKIKTEQQGTADEFEVTSYYAVMSDKHILRKRTWHNSAGKLESIPWNDMGRLSGEVEAYVTKLKAAGYTPAS